VAVVRVADIKQAVAAEFGCPLDAMSEPDSPGSRNFERSHPRQLAICLSSRLTEHSLSRIGHFFGGRDHSTVISACAAVEKRGRSDPKVHEAMRRITLELIGKAC
jgi:chromosomal replication initiator protein